MPADRVALGPLRPISAILLALAICADMSAAGASVGSRVATNELRAQQLVLGDDQGCVELHLGSDERRSKAGLRRSDLCDLCETLNSKIVCSLWVLPSMLGTAYIAAAAAAKPALAPNRN